MRPPCYDPPLFPHLRPLRKLMKKKSWKTTLFGSGGLVAVWLPVILALVDGDPATAPNFNLAISVTIPALGLLFARDNDVTSEQAGAK